MAKAPAPAADAPAAEGAAPKKKSKMMIIIAAVVVVLIAAGAAAFFIMKKNKGGEEGESAESHAPAKKAKDHSHPPAFVNLEPFTVNLTPENGEQYLQVVVVFKLPDEKSGEGVKVYMPELRHRILMTLSSKKASELSTADGRMELANQIMDEANSVVGTPGRTDKNGKKVAAEGPIEAVLFTSFIIQ